MRAIHVEEAAPRVRLRLPWSAMRLSRASIRMIALLSVVLPLGCGEEAPAPAASVEPAEAPPAYAADGSRLAGESTAPAASPNLIVLVIDALRHDALAEDLVAPRSAGKDTARMPFLKALAGQGVRFDNAAAPAPWTLPSMLSLFTGMLPSVHGQCHPDDSWPLPDAVTTFAEILRNGHGYETAAFLNGDWFVRRRDSLLQGFTTKRTRFSLLGAAEDLGAWNRERDSTRPFFLVLHSYEAHDPYGARNHPWPPVYPRLPRPDPALLEPDADPADVFRQCFLSGPAGVVLGRQMGIRLRDTLQRYKFSGYRANPRPDLANELREAYWEGARWVDGLLRSTYANLREMGLLENTLLVVTSDHGEAFGEHGSLAHGLFLYDELVRIPMVMHGPPPFGGGKIVASEIGLIDVLPTFLDWAGMEAQAGVAGRSALGPVEGRDWCRPVISEEPLTRANTGEDMEAVRISARTRLWKYVVTLDLRTAEVWEEAYDLATDPDELEDLAEGKGRLPDHLQLDSCMCPAVEAVRNRVWPAATREASSDGEAVYTTPYGAAPMVPSRRPAPCRPPH